MGEGKIVYQHRTGIWVYDLASGRSDQVPIQLPSDRLQERECFVDPKATLGSWALSKDGERIAWADEKHRLRVTDALTGADASVDLSEGEITKYVWSPDSRTLAYVVTLKNLFGQVRVWDAETRKSVPGTDPMFHSFSPAWDPKEKFLYFLSGRYINPYLDQNEPRFIVNDATLPFVLALQADGALPFVPRGDVDPPKPDEKDAKDGKKDDAKDAKKGTAKEEEKPTPIRIDFDGLAERVVQVLVPAGNYDELRALEGKLHWLRIPNKEMTPDSNDPKERPEGDLVTFDLEKEKLSTVSGDVLVFEVSANGRVLVFEQKDGFTRLEAGATASPKDEPAKEAKVDLSGWTVSIDPRDEWKQMLHEAWRRQRDFFYDPKMHGVDWDGIWKQHGPLADRISSHDDLADLLGEIFGELSVGHAYQLGARIRRVGPAREAVGDRRARRRPRRDVGSRSGRVPRGKGRAARSCRRPPAEEDRAGPEGPAAPATDRPEASPAGELRRLPTGRLFRMRVVTWNVNSVRARLDRLLAFLARQGPDVVCLQELKVTDADFPREALEAAGWKAVTHGQKTYNGVAILSREEPADVEWGMGDADTDPEARLIAATVKGVRVVSAYVPNGKEVGSEKWAYKLRWLGRLQVWAASHLDSRRPAVLCGDFNIAPGDRDVKNPEKWRETVLCHPDARAAFEALKGLGLVDALRQVRPEDQVFTWWDYRELGFPKNDGLRIDHLLVTPPLAARLASVSVDRDERKGKLPSDHAPVIAEFGEFGE